MPDKKLQLKIICPGHTLLDDAVDMVILRTVKGDKGILAGHERCVIMLGSGLMRIRRGREWDEPYLVNGGYATVEDNTVVVMSVITERISRMESLMEDLERRRIKRKADNEKWEQEIKKTEAALRRVLVENSSGSHAVLMDSGGGKQSGG